MTVTYDSYEAQVVQAVIGMLAASATFQAIVGAVDATAARAKIIESWGGTPAQSGRGPAKATAVDLSTFTITPPFAAVHITDLPSTSIAVGVFEHNGSCKIDLLLARLIGAEKPPESYRRARNQAGGVRADLEAQFGTAGCLARGAVDLIGPELAADSGADGDAFFATLTISFEG